MEGPMKKLFFFIALLIMMQAGVYADDNTATIKWTAPTSGTTFSTEVTTGLGTVSSSPTSKNSYFDQVTNKSYPNSSSVTNYFVAYRTGNSSNITDYSSDYMVSFTFTPASTYGFKPTSVLPAIAQESTSEMGIQVEVKQGSKTLVTEEISNLPRIDDSNKNDPYATAINISDAVVSNEAVTVNLKIKLRATVKRLMVNSITLTGTYEQTTSSLVASGSESTWSYDTDDTKTWDFSSVSFSDFAGKTEWTADATDPTYYYVNTPITNREFNISGLGGLRFTKGSSDYLQFNKTNTSNPNRFRYSGGNSITIPGVEKGATITVYHTNKWYGDGASSVPTLSNNVKLPSADGSQETSITGTYYPATYEVTTAGDVTITAPTDFITIAKIVVTKPTTSTIATTKTASTSIGTSWDFTATDGKAWAEFKEKANADTVHWTHYTTENDNYRPAATTGTETEYTPALLSGLIFGNAVEADYPCPDYTAKYLWMQSTSTIKLPQVEAGAVIVITANAVPTAVTGATKVASLSGKYVYQVGTSAADVTFTLPDIQISKIEVVGNTTTITTTKPSTGANKSWTLTGADNYTTSQNACAAAPAEWVIDDDGATYRPTTQLTSTTYYTVPVIAGLGFTTTAQNLLALDPKNGLWLGANATITIPAVTSGAKITVTTTTTGATVTATNATAVDGSTNTFTASADGDVVLTVGAENGMHITAISVSTTVTTIATTQTESTATGKKWTFPDTNNYSADYDKIKAVDGTEWEADGSTRYLSKLGDNADPTEYNLKSLAGLRFQKTGSNQLRYNYDGDVEALSGVKVIVPKPAEGAYVLARYTLSSGSSPSMQTSGGTTIVANWTTVLIKANGSDDVSFYSKYRNMTLQSIQVLADLPKAYVKVSYAGLDLNTELWNDTKFDGTNANGSDMTRTVKGFTFAFSGGDGVKAAESDYLTVKNNQEGAITITAPAGAIITGVTLTDGAASADNYTATVSAGTVTPSADATAKTTTFTVTGGGYGNSLTLTHVKSAPELHVSDIKVDYQGVADVKATPVLGFGADATVDASDKSKATFTVVGGSKIYLQYANNKTSGKHYLDKASVSWKLKNSTVTSSDTEVLKVEKDDNGAVTITANNSSSSDVTATLAVQYVPTTDGRADTLFNSSNTLTFTVTVKPNTSGNRTIEVQKLLYSYRKGGQTKRRSIGRTVRGIDISFDETEYDKGVFVNTTDTKTLADKASDNINITSKGSMTLAFDNSNLATTQQGHARFTKVTFLSTSELDKSKLSTYLTTAATGWKASLSDDKMSLTFSGPATNSLTFAGGSAGITFTQFDFDWAGDALWPGGDLTDYKPTPTLTAKTKQIWLTKGDVTGSNGVSRANINCSVGSFFFGTTYSSSDKDVATVDGSNNVKAVAESGEADITGTITMKSFGDNNDYFTIPSSPITDSYHVIVQSPNHTDGAEWNFADAGTHGISSEAQYVKIGYDKDNDMYQTFGSSYWTTVTNNDSTEYELTNALVSTETFGALTIDGSSTVNRTNGLSFNQSSKDQIKVNPGRYLWVNDRVHIKISNVKKDAVILVRAYGLGDDVGFKEDDQTNLSVLDDDHETSVRETDFMFRADAQGDVILKPTGDMKIYRIKVYPKEVTMMYVNMTAKRSNGAYKYSTLSAADNNYYGYSGFKGLNDNSQKQIVPRMNQGNTATLNDAKLWSVPRNGLDGKGITLNDYLATTNDLSGKGIAGTWTYYSADESVATVSGLTVTAVAPGVTTIIAKFVPTDQTKYAITYGFFSFYVNERTAFRVESGMDLGYYNKDKTTLVDGKNYKKVNQKVWTPDYGTFDDDGNMIDNSAAADIICTVGGWDGDTDNARDNGSEMTDNWDLGKKDAYVRTQDGFDFAVNANANSSDEEGRKYTTGMNPSTVGTNKTGENITLSNTDGTLTDDQVKDGLVAGTPYQMPCRGGFLKFQPRKNGQLTVYIHQNGAICTDKNDDYTPGGFHMRSYFVADETGHLFSQNATTDDYKLTVTSHATLNKWANNEDGLNQFYNETSANGYGANEWADHKDEFEWFQNEEVSLQPTSTARTATTKKKLSEFKGDEWNGYYQPVLDYNGAQVTIDESQCKYVFNVKAGKTYFMFTGGTSMGFCGFKFVPTENVGTQKVSLPEETKTDALTSLEGFDNSKYSQVSLTRGFTANAWNAVCFPFTMNEEQCQEVFGDGYEILDFDRTTSKTIVFKKHHYQMIVAGRPYLVWTSKSSFTAPTKGYVNFGDALTSPVEVKDLGTNGFVFKGSYNKTTAPQYSYYVTKSGKVKQTTNSNGISLKGYRAWLHSSSVQGAKEFVVSINGVEEMVTGIENVVADLKDPVTNGNVYSLSGVKVSSNGLQNLPAGIYIMNGKKYVVK